MWKKAFALGVAAMGTGCVYYACTEMACGGSLEVTVYNVALDDGEYRAEADLDAGTEAVSFDIVEGEAQVPDDSWVSVSYDGVDLVVEFTTGMGDMPETVPFRLLDATELVVVEGDLSPDWGETWYPNGKECDDVGCASGTAAL